MKTCPQCSVEFKPANSSSIHCSHACRSETLKAPKGPLTQDRLKALLRYEPKTGLFTWRATKGRSIAGAIAGSIAGARRSISVDAIQYIATRLAWFYMTGEWPRGEIDHIDTDSTNDRWTNLRDVTRRVNQENMRQAKANNKTGFLGVSAQPRGGNFHARIHVGGKTKCLGTYTTPEQAHAAYVAVKRQLHEGSTL